MFFQKLGGVSNFGHRFLYGFGYSHGIHVKSNHSPERTTHVLPPWKARVARESGDYAGDQTQPYIFEIHTPTVV